MYVKKLKFYLYNVCIKFLKIDQMVCITDFIFIPVCCNLRIPFKMNGNKSPLEDWIEEGKARKEFKKEIYAEINKVKADLENKIRSCDTKVENLETTVQELRKKVPASQKDLSNAELLEQLKEKDSRILLMGANSKRIITLMKQKLVTKEEKIRQLDKENLNNAKRIKLLEEELSKHSLDLNENFDNAELNDAKVGEVKPANNDGANPIDTKLPEDIKKEFVKDDLSMKNESEVRKDAVVDSVCRPTSEDIDVKDTVIGSLKVSKEEKVEFHYFIFSLRKAKTYITLDILILI